MGDENECTRLPFISVLRVRAGSLVVWASTAGMEPFAENATALFWYAEAVDKEATTSNIMHDNLCGAIAVRFVIGIVTLVDLIF